MLVCMVGHWKNQTKAVDGLRFPNKMKNSKCSLVSCDHIAERVRGQLIKHGAPRTRPGDGGTLGDPLRGGGRHRRCWGRGGRRPTRAPPRWCPEFDSLQDSGVGAGAGGGGVAYAIVDNQAAE